MKIQNVIDHIESSQKELVNHKIYSKISSVDDISLKEGKSGKLCFVKAKYEFYVNNEIKIKEFHNIVYREIGENQNVQRVELPFEKFDNEKSIYTHPTIMFRYSAITFNGHRIHYDYPYSTKEEFYPDLVFHGPLQATLLLHLSEENANKTAKKFIKQYGSLENLLQNAHEVTGKLGEKIIENKELGVLSKKLAKIILDVPIDYNLDEFKLSDPDKEIVLKVFDELEFRRIKETFFKIFGTISSPIEEKGAEVVQGDLFSETYNLESNKDSLNGSKSIYQRIESFEELKILVEKMMKQEIVAFDTETEGLNALETDIVGISFSWQKGIGYYLPIKNNKSVHEKSFEILKPFFESTEIIKVGHNIKFDIQVLHKYNVKVSSPIYDTMVAHYLINPDMRHNLDTLSESYLNYSPISIESLIGKKGKNQISMRDVSIDKITDYASEDADITLQLKSIFDKEIEVNNLSKIFYDIEIPMINVLSEMETEGIKIDTSYLEKLDKEFEEDLEKIKKWIENNPNLGNDLMERNKSFVFFYRNFCTHSL